MKNVSVDQQQASLIRCRSPVHIHVDDTTPVHVHVQKKKLEGISVSLHHTNDKVKVTWSVCNI